MVSDRTKYLMGVTLRKMISNVRLPGAGCVQPSSFDAKIDAGSSNQPRSGWGIPQHHSGLSAHVLQCPFMQHEPYTRLIRCHPYEVHQAYTYPNFWPCSMKYMYMFPTFYLYEMNQVYMFAINDNIVIRTSSAQLIRVDTTWDVHIPTRQFMPCDVVRTLLCHSCPYPMTLWCMIRIQLPGGLNPGGL